MADGFYITPQDLWQDFETLDGAQKVSYITCFAPYLEDLWWHSLTLGAGMDADCEVESFWQV